MKNRAFILRGEGIECEVELKRFLELRELNFECHYVDVPMLLKDPREYFYSKLEASDWVFFPGGFSFSDHFGSGRLLSYLLEEISFFDELIKKSCHMFGICNGFQVLTQAKLFGKNLRLRANHDQEGVSLGFRNQWVFTKMDSLFPDSSELMRLCVRHGEGRVDLGSSELESHVKAILRYQDPRFSNGSFDQIAGLFARHQKSFVMGMMPHPEVSFRMIDDPDYSGPDFTIEQRHKKLESLGDGMKLFKTLFSMVTLNKGDM